jgi:hypothetical protein
MPSLYGSPLRVTWNPGGSGVVLVDFGDELIGDITLNGQRIVQTSNRVRSAGGVSFDRGNKRNVFKIARRKEQPTLQDALSQALYELATVPDGAADVLFEIQGQTQTFTLQDATIGDWDGGIPTGEMETFAIIGRTISGGAFILTP